MAWYEMTGLASVLACVVMALVTWYLTKDDPVDDDKRGKKAH